MEIAVVGNSNSVLCFTLYRYPYSIIISRVLLIYSGSCFQDVTRSIHFETAVLWIVFALIVRRRQGKNEVRQRPPCAGGVSPPRPRRAVCVFRGIREGSGGSPDIRRFFASVLVFRVFRQSHPLCEPRTFLRRPFCVLIALGSSVTTSGPPSPPGRPQFGLG